MRSAHGQVRCIAGLQESTAHIERALEDDDRLALLRVRVLAGPAVGWSMRPRTVTSGVATFTSTTVDPPKSSNLSSDMARSIAQLEIVNVAVSQRVLGRMRATFSVFFDS